MWLVTNYGRSWCSFSGCFCLLGEVGGMVFHCDWRLGRSWLFKERGKMKLPRMLWGWIGKSLRIFLVPSSLGRLLGDSSTDGSESALGRHGGCWAPSRTPLSGKPRKFLLNTTLVADSVPGHPAVSPPLCNYWFMVLSYFLTAWLKFSLINVCRDEQVK